MAAVILFLGDDDDDDFAALVDGGGRRCRCRHYFDALSEPQDLPNMDSNETNKK